MIRTIIVRFLTVVVVMVTTWNAPAISNEPEVASQLFLSEVNGFPKLADLPLLRRGVQTHQFCSYDRAGDNYDHEYFPLYQEPNGECVIFDAFGPGCLYRHHMNIWHTDSKGVNIRYYFDDESKPRIDMDISTFFSSANPLGIFVPPMADDGGTEYRILYHPMFFKKRLKVALSKEPGGPGSDQIPWIGHYSKIPQRRSHWYQYTYHLFTCDPGFASWTEPMDLSEVASQWTNYGINQGGINQGGTVGEDGRVHKGDLVVEPGNTGTLFTSQNSGAITSMKIFLKPLARDALFNSWLKIYWDGEPQPSVSAPLGAFFGAYPEKIETSYSSMMLGYGGSKGMYCFFPMPYWKSARIVLENRSKTRISPLQFEITEATNGSKYPAKKSGYFHAVYERQAPRQEGHDFTYLETTGSGHIVGHSVSRWETSMEENERTYFDGSRTPQIQGDGFEDDQGFGWGLKPKSLAVFGSPVPLGGSGSLYRFFIPDLYVFYSSVKHGHLTYGPHSPRGHEGMYKVGSEASVTYYYAVDEPSLILSDELNVGDSDSETSHRYVATGAGPLQAASRWYDGELNNVLFKTPPIIDVGRNIRGSSEFTVRVDPTNQGIRIRRRTDKENNRQLARVYVDGQLVVERPWYTVDFENTYRSIRWRDTDFEVPAAYTQGKDSLRIRIEPCQLDNGQSENGGLDEFHYWVFSYR